MQGFVCVSACRHIKVYIQSKCFQSNIYLYYIYYYIIFIY